MKKIKLTQGKYALVDNEDFGRLSQYSWHYVSIGYAVRGIGGSPEKARSYYMHWDVIGKPKNGLVTDHINGKKLDNRKENLRHVTIGQNVRKQKMNKNNTSGYRGVCRHKNPPGYWKASISINGKVTSVGFFKRKEDAARAYDKAAKKHYGEFARLNFPNS